MLLPTVPDPDAVLAALLPVCHCVWQALEVGAGSAHHYFHGGDIDDRALAAHLTRYQAKHVLDGVQQDVEFERDDLPTSGLLLHKTLDGQHYIIRIRRSGDGKMPGAQSVTMNEFYYQPVIPGLGPTFAQPASGGQPISVMLLWNTNADYSAVTSLILVCPELADGNEVHEHWRRYVPHPLVSTTATTPTEAPAEDLPMEDAADEGEATGE